MAKSFNLTNPVADIILNRAKEETQEYVKISSSSAGLPVKKENKKKNSEKKIIKTINISEDLYKALVRIVAQKTIDCAEKAYSFSSLVEEVLKNYVEENQQK